MKELLLPLLFLACPLMMVFMMRGMHGGHGSSGAGHDAPATRDAPVGHEEGQAPDGRTSDDRIALLEAEVARLRALQGEPEDPWLHR